MRLLSIAWFIALVVGTLLTFSLNWAMHVYARKLPHLDTQVSPTRIPWIPALVGILERSLFTLLIGFGVSGAAAFIGPWVTIKAIGGWARWSEDKSESGRALFSTGLIGSGVSALFGTWSGILVANSRQPGGPTITTDLTWKLVLIACVIGAIATVLIWWMPIPEALAKRTSKSPEEPKAA